LKKFLLLLFVLLFSMQSYSQQIRYSQQQLFEDTRQLLNLIEETHPDPYLNSGGKIEFHRRFHTVMQSIPDSGMTLQEYVWLVQPFMNFIGDGHTVIRHPFFTYNPKVPTGMPFWFSVFSEKGLYIKKVARNEFESLLGAKLISVEGFSIQELLQKTRRLYPSQNDYDCLSNLNAMLWEKYFFEQFLPECAAENHINVEIELVNGKREKINIDLSIERNYPLITNNTRDLELPSTKRSDFSYKFLDQDRKTAFLRIDGQDGYREIVEYAHFHGFDLNNIRQFSKPVYERYNDEEAPENIDSLIAGIPSVTEVFRNLVIEMEKSKSENLIIDLSCNSGGQSILSQILVYFLYGKNQLLELQKSYSSVEKLSDYYFKVFVNKDLDEINKRFFKFNSYLLTNNDYDFSVEEDYISILNGETTVDSLMNRLNEEFYPYTSFYNEFESGKYDGFYKPKKIIVICSERTYSAGFGTLVDLYKSGAIVVGVPSGQSANNFGNSVYFKLNNSGTDGFVSTKYIEMFPKDNALAKELISHYPITYDILKKYNFDSQTVYHYVLDSLSTF